MTTDASTCAICAQAIDGECGRNTTGDGLPMHRWMTDCIPALRKAVATLTRERDAATAEVQRLHDAQRLQHDALMIAEGQRDQARADAAMLADSIEDFVGAQGTAYELDQYLMLQGVLSAYNGQGDAGATDA